MPQDLLAVLAGKEEKDQDINRITDHNSRDGEDLGCDAPNICQDRGDHRYGQAAVESGRQYRHCQHGIDAGTGDQLTHRLCQSLQGYQQRQHNGGFRDPTNFLVHGIASSW